VGDVAPGPVRHRSVQLMATGGKTTSSALFQTAPPAFDVDMKWSCVSERERNKKAVVLEKIYLDVYYYQRTVSSHISVRSLSVLFPNLKWSF
jgi:hypothetical protein